MYYALRGKPIVSHFCGSLFIKLNPYQTACEDPSLMVSTVGHATRDSIFILVLLSFSRFHDGLGPFAEI